MPTLTDIVAVVTGASRGLGRGIALGLGEAGATVYVTGRSTRDRPGSLPGTIEDTADEVSRLGGRGIAVVCDHRDDAQVEALFTRVIRDQPGLDVLVNNAMGSPEQRVLWGSERFWRIPVSLWNDLIDVGVRSHFVATRFAAPGMVERGRGFVINVASHAAGRGRSEKSRSILPYSVGKAALHRLSGDMAVELKPHGVSVIEIWPPASRTEGVLAEPDTWGDLTGWKPPLFTGRVVAALVAAGHWLARSGQTIVIDDVAPELGITEMAT